MGNRKRKEERVQGLSLSKGVALGRVCLFDDHRHHRVPEYHIAADEVDKECMRLEKGLHIAADQLEDIRKNVIQNVGKAEAEIFNAQKMILEDPILQKEMREHIGAHFCNAEQALSHVLNSYEAKLRNLDNEYIQERASDIGEIKRRLLDNMSNSKPDFNCAGSDHCLQGQNRVVIAEELTPSLTVSMNTREVMAFVTEHGGIHSHAAILARSLGIPAVSGIKNIHSIVPCGTELIVNGDTGEVIISPEKETVSSFSCDLSERRQTEAIAPVETLQVLANISLSANVSDAVAMMAEGIGLYRTEFEFISAGRVLTEEEQYLRYALVVKEMKGAITTFRMLDIGGDKALPSMNIPREDNPALGLRGSRLLLKYPDLLKTQARAIARASQLGPVRVLYPMIVDVEQFIKLRSIFQEASADIQTGEIEHGVMFEVPSAVFRADAVLREAEFASIGTNDLTQYFFAVDRDNESVADDYQPDHPAFLELLKNLVEVAGKYNRPLSICGEMASDLIMVKKLVECGVKSVSVSSRLIPGVRTAVSL